MVDAQEPDAATLANLRAELDDARRQLAEARDQVETQQRQLDAIAQDRDAAVASLAFERRRFAGLLEKAPAFMAITRGPDHVVEFANAAFHEATRHRPIVGKAMIDALPEIAAQGFIE